eukprot:scaffold653_cov379-Prasinococcus_capsulatus_cf.AAC.6
MMYGLEQERGRESLVEGKTTMQTGEALALLVIFEKEVRRQELAAVHRLVLTHAARQGMCLRLAQVMISGEHNVTSGVLKAVKCRNRLELVIEGNTNAPANALELLQALTVVAKEAWSVCVCRIPSSSVQHTSKLVNSSLLWM